MTIALLNNAATRASWLAAMSIQARYDGELAALRPRLTGQAAALAREAGGGSSKDLVSLTPSITLSWLLHDFGQSEASLEGTRGALEAADWAHNGVIADTVLSAIRSYYAYNGARSSLAARQANLRSAETARRVAEARHEAGTATASDTLQAKAAVARAMLALQTAEGAARTARGALLAAMGLPATLDARFVDADPRPDTKVALGQLDALVARALASRSDLLAARASSAAAEALLRRSEAQRMPTVTLSASAGVTGGITQGDTFNLEHTEAASLLLTVPLLTGGAQEAAERRAGVDLAAARERERGLANQVVAQVFASWQAVTTAAARIEAATEFLAAAEEGEKVALGRYREGVGTILELTTAESDLAEARLQQDSARWEWFTSLAQLARDAGLLLPDGTIAHPTAGGTP